MTVILPFIILFFPPPRYGAYAYPTQFLVHSRQISVNENSNTKYSNQKIYRPSILCHNEPESDPKPA